MSSLEVITDTGSLVMLFFLLGCANYPTPIEDLFTEAERMLLQTERPNMLVRKSDETLYLIREGTVVRDADGEIVAWPVSFGTGVNDGDKEREGDKRTPEGVYTYTDYSSSSSYHGSLLIHYPGPDDATRALAAGRITKTVHDQVQNSAKNGSVPPMLTGMGGYILVHGTHKKGNLFPSNVRYLWTDGCVGMSNDDIDALRDELDADGGRDQGKILITKG